LRQIFSFYSENEANRFGTRKKKMISLEENPTIDLHDEIEKQDLHSILCQTKNDESKNNP
jgi:hypothetical protein